MGLSISSCLVITASERREGRRPREVASRHLLLALALCRLWCSDNVPLAQRPPGRLRRDAVEPAQVSLDTEERRLRLPLATLRLRRRSRRLIVLDRAAEARREPRQSSGFVLFDGPRRLGVRARRVPELVVEGRGGEGDERSRGGGVEELVRTDERAGGRRGRGLQKSKEKNPESVLVLLARTYTLSTTSTPPAKPCHFSPGHKSSSRKRQRKRRNDASSLSTPAPE